jgi:hypothetical protein
MSKVVAIDDLPVPITGSIRKNEQQDHQLEEDYSAVFCSLDRAGIGTLKRFTL